MYFLDSLPPWYVENGGNKIVNSQKVFRIREICLKPYALVLLAYFWVIWTFLLRRTLVFTAHLNGYSVSFTTEGRRGRLAVPKTVNRNAPASVRRAMECSLPVKGANLFILLPLYIRNLNALNAVEVGIFKSKLDVFLSRVPDQPTIQGSPRAAETNSLIHQIPLLE